MAQMLSSPFGQPECRESAARVIDVLVSVDSVSEAECPCDLSKHSCVSAK